MNYNPFITTPQGSLCELWDDESFGLVCRRGGDGLQALADYSKFFEKIAAAEADFSKAISKACKDVMKNRKNVRNVGNCNSGTVFSTFTVIIDKLEQKADFYRVHSERLQAVLVDAYESHQKTTTKIYKQYCDDGKKDLKNIEMLSNAVMKAKRNYFSAGEQAENDAIAHANAQGDPLIEAKELAKMTQKAVKSREKERDLMVEYEKAVEEYNSAVLVHRDEFMPTLLTNFEALELDRLAVVAKSFKNFAEMYEGERMYIGTAEAEITVNVDGIRPNEDVNMFGSEYRTTKRPLEEIEPQYYEPSCRFEGDADPNEKKSWGVKATFFKRNRTETKAAGEGSGGSSGPSSSSAKYVRSHPMFGCSIDEILSRQRSENGDGETPKILNVLIAALLRLNAARTEGIFRVPASAAQVVELKGQFESGDFSALDAETLDVHLPAALLKLWLRELSEPLIPTRLYDKAITVSTPAEAVALIDELPLSSRRVIDRIMDLVSELAKDESIEATRMNIPNIAMVFTPSFLRNPSDDAMAIMLNTKLESEFTQAAIRGLLDRRSGIPLAAAPAAAPAAVPAVGRGWNEETTGNDDGGSGGAGGGWNEGNDGPADANQDDESPPLLPRRH